MTLALGSGPMNVGDVYAIQDYTAKGLTRYGAAFREADPDSPTPRWRWAIEMDDGDLYPWIDGQWDMVSGAQTLVRRNPLPDWEEVRTC